MGKIILICILSSLITFNMGCNKTDKALKPSQDIELVGEQGEDEPEADEPETESLIYEHIEYVFTELLEDSNTYFQLGMKLLITGEREYVNDQLCYLVIMGTDHGDSFVREVFYAINIENDNVYKYDAITDAWEPLPVDFTDN